MGLMYAWATPEKCLDELSLNQLIKYYQKGWDARQTENRVNWGIFATLLNGENKTDTSSKTQSQDQRLEEYRRYPGYETCYFNEKGKLIKG